MIFASPLINGAGGGLTGVGPLGMATGGGGGSGGGGGALMGDVDFGGDAFGTGGGGGRSLLGGSGVAMWECGLLDRDPLSFRTSM